MANAPTIDPRLGVDQVALNDLAFDLAKRYQENLAAAQVNASGALSKAAINYIFTWKGETLQLIFRLPEEWYYVEHGRDSTTGKTGKPWPNAVEDIIRWIRVKHITPRSKMRSARVPSSRKPVPSSTKERQMAEAIVRKIHREGFYSPGHQGKHLLQEAIVETDIKNRLRGILTDALGREIKVELGDLLASVGAKK